MLPPSVYHRQLMLVCALPCSRASPRPHLEDVIQRGPVVIIRVLQGAQVWGGAAARAPGCRKAWVPTSATGQVPLHASPSAPSPPTRHTAAARLTIVYSFPDPYRVHTAAGARGKHTVGTASKADRASAASARAWEPPALLLGAHLYTRLLCCHLRQRAVGRQVWGRWPLPCSHGTSHSPGYRSSSSQVWPGEYLRHSGATVQGWLGAAGLEAQAAAAVAAAHACKYACA